MTDPNKQVDENKGDDVLKRMLKTPPAPKTPPKPKPGEGKQVDATNDPTQRS